MDVLTREFFFVLPLSFVVSAKEDLKKNEISNLLTAFRRAHSPESSLYKTKQKKRKEKRRDSQNTKIQQ
jgi:hypothetical protein